MKKKKTQEGWSIADLQRIANQKPTGLSHAWVIGAAKKALDKLNNTEG